MFPASEICGLFSDNDISRGVGVVCWTISTIRHPIPNRQSLVWQCTKLWKDFDHFLSFNLLCLINNMVLNHLIFLWGKLVRHLLLFSLCCTGRNLCNVSISTLSVQKLVFIQQSQCPTRRSETPAQSFIFLWINLQLSSYIRSKYLGCGGENYISGVVTLLEAGSWLLWVPALAANGH